MNWKEYERKHNLRYYPRIYLERLRKTTKNLSQDSQSLALPAGRVIFNPLTSTN
jgi:hypothetical protein